MANNARLPDAGTLIQAGIDPTTHLPIKAKDENKCTLKSDIRRVIRILDEQDAINRYKWYNLPSGLDGQLLERILYFKGQGILFYMEATNQFLFLPFALDGSIDVYGRFKSVTPLPFNGVAETKDDAWILGMSKIPVYDIMDIPNDAFDKGCVIIRDISQQMPQTNIPRAILQEPILDAESEAFPLARTSLIAHCGVKGMRVNDEDQQSNVKSASRSILKSALTGDPYVPIVGNIEFQELVGDSPTSSEDYLLYMQSIDNFRLSLLGLQNGGIFEKQAHVLQAEQSMNASNTGRIIQDGLTIRQKACDIINAIWGLGVSCELSETVTGVDSNLDGEIDDQQDQNGMAGEQPTGGIEDVMQ